MYWDELATGEAELVHIITEDAADGIGLKVTKCGGLTRARRQRDMCVAAGYTLSVQDTTGSDIAFAAIVHLAQTVPGRLLRCALDCRRITDTKTATGSYAVTDGTVTAPSDPGLGITPLPEVLGSPVAEYTA
jgi:L-alanine-DL-glutamate epimerase-like enolase superfamily enzyme